MPAKDFNPFAKREEFSNSNLVVYKVLTFVTWLLVVVSGVYYTFHAPDDCRHNRHHNDHSHYSCHTIWGQNNRHPSPFALNSVVTSVYWIVILVLQAQYLRYLYHADTSYKNSAANVGSYFIFSNLLTFGFIMLWVRGRFWIAEILLIINMFNLTMLYFEHSKSPRLIHVPIVSGPLAWTYVAILWCGAAAVNARNTPARIVANLFIWGILVLGAFFLLIFKDYTIGLELAILSLALALGQLSTRVIAFQWVFAFVIMGCLIVLSVIVGIPGLVGDVKTRPTGIVSEDRERDPLLEDH